VPVDEVNSEVPSALAAIVMRCLEKMPEARWQRGADLAGALEKWLYEVGARRDARVHAGTPSGSAVPVQLAMPPATPSPASGPPPAPGRT
jgi:hypothetical protein